MKSGDRRSEIYKILSESKEAVSAGAIAEIFGVTRQIIVKDIGILKAEKYDIIPTSKGYILNRKNVKFTRSIYVCHSAEQMEDELCTIVDLGGRALTTHIEHSVYGAIDETLNIKCRKDIVKFLQNINNEGCQPLLRLTNGRHTHLIEADDEETLDEICQVLKEKGYLI